MATVREIRGRWFLDYRDAAGRRHIERAGDGKSKRRADALLRRRIAEIETGTFRPPRRRTLLRDYATAWIERRRPDLTADTWRTYRGHVRAHIVPMLGDVPLAALNRPLLLTFKAKLIADNPKFSPHSINRILQRLAQILEDAVKDGEILANPARSIPHLAQPREEMDFLTLSELRRLLAAADAVGPAFHAAVKVAVLTGLRQGEQRGLRWRDIDLDRGELRVQTGRHRDRRLRTVQLSGAVVWELRRHRMASGNPAGTALVWPGRKPDLPVSPQYWSQQLLRRALRGAGLRESFRWHDLRHTFASLHFALGASPKWIQRQLGHSSIQITMDRYTHLLPDSGERELATLDEALFHDPNVAELVISP